MPGLEDSLACFPKLNHCPAASNASSRQLPDASSSPAGPARSVLGSDAFDSVNPPAGIGYLRESGLNATGDGWRARAAMVAGRDPGTGITAEILGVELEAGAQNTARAVTMKLGVETDSGRSKLEAEALSAEARAGTHNKDGSVGLNLGACASLGVVEGRIGGEANEVSAALSLSIGAELSAGARDIDGDGSTEYCVRAGALFLALGFCLEI